MVSPQISIVFLHLERYHLRRWGGKGEEFNRHARAARASRSQRHFPLGRACVSAACVPQTIQKAERRMSFYVRLIVFAAALLGVSFGAARAESQNLAGFGVVLIHGKGGTPGLMMGGLGDALKAAGAIVVTPEMPWSFNRIYDATYDEAMLEIDRAVDELKRKGATKIVIGGHSMGANASIGYAARRDGIAAVVALAPGHPQDTWYMRLRTKRALEQAKELIAAGQGDVRMSWPDMAQGIPFSVHATPNVYVSMFDPEGPATMSKNAAAMGDTPLLWVAGLADPIVFSGRDYAFNMAKNPKSKYLVLPATHMTTPFQARNSVVDWLKSL